MAGMVVAVLLMMVLVLPVMVPTAAFLVVVLVLLMAMLVLPMMVPTAAGVQHLKKRNTLFRS